MKLNEKILYCRKKAGLSQVDLADLLGVSRQSVSKWETGESNPDVTKIPVLAKAFGVTADWLLSEEEPSDSPEPVPEATPVHPVSAFPEWVDNLPKGIASLIRKYGWIMGVRMAIGGAMTALIGIMARAMFKTLIFSNQNAFSSGGFYPGIPGFEDGYGYGFSAFTSFTNSAWNTASLFTGFIIALGLVTAIAGVVLAVALKNWGTEHHV